MNGNSEKNPIKWKKILMTAACVFLALMLIAMVAVMIFVQGHLDSLGTITEPSNTLSSSELEDILNPSESVDEELPTLEEDYSIPAIPQESLPEQQDHVINILLIGQDRHQSGTRRARSDAMILCTFNTATKTITMSSFLRDSYVAIPGYGNNRMNAAFVFGGTKLLKECVYVNYGVSVDGCFEVDFQSFKQVIDAVGGVDIELTQAEANHLNSQNRSWGLVAGMNHLSGEPALAYSRIRVIGDDWGRTARQRKVMTSIIDKCRSMSIFELNGLLDTVLPLINTDMTNSQIMGYMVDLFPMLSGCTINSQSIPAPGTWNYARVNGMSVIQINFEKNRQILQEAMSTGETE